MTSEVEEKPMYALVASVQLPNVTDLEFEASLTELRELAKTLGFKVVHTFVQKRASFDTTGYLGVASGRKSRSLPAIPPTARSTRCWSTTKFRHRRRAIWRRKAAAR